MKVHAVIPLSAVPRIKTRLAGVLGLAERAALARWMAGRVLDAVQASGVVDEIAVVSPDEQALAWAARRGAVALRQHGGRLNAALEIGRRWALTGNPYEAHDEWGSTAGHTRPDDPRDERASSARPDDVRGADALLVVLGDLPYLTASDVASIVRLLPVDATGAVLAPDRHERGTNALLLRPPDALPFAFGRDSFQRHVARAVALGVRTVWYTSEGTRRDVDTPDDLAALVASGLWHPATVS